VINSLLTRALFVAPSVALLLASVLEVCAQTPSTQPPPLPANPQIQIAYVKPTNPTLTAIYTVLQNNKVLETLQQFLSPLKLPAGTTLTVQFNQCGAPTVPFKHGGPVTICYEYVSQVVQLVPKSVVPLVQGTLTPQAAIDGPVVQAVLHETAIGIFDALNLPVWGRLDDAADRTAAFIMMQFGPTIAWNTIVGGAWFLSANVNVPPDFASVIGIVAERYYTMICIAYGGEVRGVDVAPAPNGQRGTVNAGFSHFVGTDAAGDLPQSRANSCPDEYDAVKQAFVTLILPYVDPALLKQVQQTTWIKFGG
jgi:hypothetical protein